MLLEKLSNFETIFMASLILDIVSWTTPLLVYLQTKSLNYAQTRSMVKTLKNQILKNVTMIKLIICIKNVMNLQNNSIIIIFF